MHFPPPPHLRSEREQWLSTVGSWGAFAPQVPSEKSGDIFGCHDWAGGPPLACRVRAEASNATPHPAGPRMALPAVRKRVPPKISAVLGMRNSSSRSSSLVLLNTEKSPLSGRFPAQFLLRLRLLLLTQGEAAGSPYAGCVLHFSARFLEFCSSQFHSLWLQFSRVRWPVVQIVSQ